MTLKWLYLKVEWPLKLRENQVQRPVATLLPGEAFTFRKSNGQFYKTQFEEAMTYQWKDGIIHFHRADIVEVVETLENWYDVRIEIKDAEKITEKLVHRIDTRKMNIDEVLEGINLVTNYRFEKIRKSEYTVAPKD